MEAELFLIKNHSRLEIPCHSLFVDAYFQVKITFPNPYKKQKELFACEMSTYGFTGISNVTAHMKTEHCVISTTWAKLYLWLWTELADTV